MAAAIRQEGAAVSDGTDTTVSGSRADHADGVPWPVYLAPLLSLLRRESTSFDFFQAVRILERLRPDREPVGFFTDPKSEVVRFGVPASISFPPAEIARLDVRDAGPATMKVNFFGLTGPQGVLPHHYTLLIAERERAKDHAMRDFFDIFHHRIISLFYRAWLKNHASVNYEKQSGDRLSEHLLDLLGQGVEFKDRGLSPLQRTLMFYVGWKTSSMWMWRSSSSSARGTRCPPRISARSARSMATPRSWVSVWWQATKCGTSRRGSGSGSARSTRRNTPISCRPAARMRCCGGWFAFSAVMHSISRHNWFSTGTRSRGASSANPTPSRSHLAGVPGSVPRRRFHAIRARRFSACEEGRERP